MARCSHQLSSPSSTRARPTGASRLPDPNPNPDPNPSSSPNPYPNPNPNPNPNPCPRPLTQTLTRCFALPFHFPSGPTEFAAEAFFKLTRELSRLDASFGTILADTTDSFYKANCVEEEANKYPLPSLGAHLTLSLSLPLALSLTLTLTLTLALTLALTLTLTLTPTPILTLTLAQAQRRPPSLRAARRAPLL